ncbi:MAG TPA: tetratricopeptide repeat protein [Spirochaetota bacterium]|nr:tetratricopeptide repeat protein [Spirochaetota bacterium]
MKRSTIERLAKGGKDAGSQHILLKGAVIGIVLGLLLTVVLLVTRTPDVYRNIEEMTEESRFEDAEKLARSLYEKDPLDVRALVLMGRNAFRKAFRFDNEKNDKTEEGWDLYKISVESLKKAILLDKKGLLTSADYFILGFAYLRKGDQYFEDALQYMKKAEELNTNDHVLVQGNDPIARFDTLQQTIGYLNYHLGRYTNALQYYRDANAKPNVLNWAYIGLCEVALGQYSNAIWSFGIVRDHANQQGLKAFATRQLAWTYFHLGRHDEARTWFEKTVSIDTNYAEGYYWLGKMAELRNDLQAARALWQKSLEADPHFGPSILKLRFSPQHKTNLK